MPQRAWVARTGGLWSVKSDARQVITAYNTEAEAVAAARSLLASSGGGELMHTDQSGVIDRETIPRRDL